MDIAKLRYNNCNLKAKTLVMTQPLDPHKSYFRGVALALILFGAIILGGGFAEWVLNIGQGFEFFAPSLKMIGGTLILGLGYIQLELELLRLQK